jgi:hypothetical protein
VFLALHLMYWSVASARPAEPTLNIRATSPWHLPGLVTLPLTHLSLKSLFSPSSALDKAHDDAKREWQKACEELKKQGKDKADFADPPSPPAGWQICVRDRKGWLAYWVWVGAVEYLELLCFGDQAGGLLWWPKVSTAPRRADV